MCLTACNHARTTLPRTGRSSPYIPRIPSHPPGTLLTQKSTPHVPQNTCGVHIYSLTATAGAPCSWYRQPPVWVPVGSFARGEPQPAAGLPATEPATRRATHPQRYGATGYLQCARLRADIHQLANTLNAGAHRLTRLQPLTRMQRQTNPRRGTRRHQVARLQGHEPRNIRQ